MLETQDNLDLEFDGEDAPDLIKTVQLDFVVDAGQEPTRIDKYLQARTEGATRSKVQDAIDNDMVLVNGVPTRNNYKVRPGDHILTYRFMLEGSDVIVPQNIPLDVRFEDEQFLILHKQPGMVVHPGSGNRDGTLVNAMSYYLQQQRMDVETLPRVGMVHRIDKDTSGLMVFAKTPHAMQHLAAQFKAHTSARTYVALVWGDVAQDEGTITGHIARHERNRMQFTVTDDEETGKHAVTHYKVLQRFGYVTVVQCVLETGRTHQIRVHFKHIGHTLFNDYRYGGDSILYGTVHNKYKQFIDNCFKLCPRHALHAKTLGVDHPLTNERMNFDSELPQDMASVIDKWAKYTSNRLT
jgi:23S rRNA pseudouridine1911/1915/1917 synthase